MANFCPKCGNAIADSGSRFCFFCGGELPSQEVGESAESVGDVSPDTGVMSPAAEHSEGDTVVIPPLAQSAEGETIRMQAVEAGAEEPSGADAGGTGSGGPPTTIIPPPGPPSRSYPWKWILLIGAACVILAAGAGAAVAFVTRSDNRVGTTSTTTAATSSTSTTKTTRTTTTKTSTSTTKTSTTSASSKTRAYIKAMDDVVARNAQLEKQIGVAADQINKVAPAGITDAMLSDIDRLGIEFLGINTEAQDLEVPAAFTRSQQDFLQLTSYNMTRCDSLYGGAISWQSGMPYQDQFAEGQAAKVSYMELYPRFEDEYGAAKSPLQ